MSIDLDSLGMGEYTRINMGRTEYQTPESHGSNHGGRYAWMCLIVNQTIFSNGKCMQLVEICPANRIGSSSIKFYGTSTAYNDIFEHQLTKRFTSGLNEWRRDVILQPAENVITVVIKN